MGSIVFRHVRVADLPAAWQARLSVASDALVTVRIKAESPLVAPPVADPPKLYETDDPAFGLWRDRVDIASVGEYARTLRTHRFGTNGIRQEL